jgi:hypothetical protein
MTRLRTVTLLLVAGLLVALAGPSVVSFTTGTSAPSAMASTLGAGDDEKWCC